MWWSVVLLAWCGADAIKYHTAGQPKPGKLNVHLVPHTHDDVGWLKTVDQYFYGANNTIQHAGVQYVLDTVVTELQKDPHRTFVYVEQAFFQRWWRQQDDETRNIVRSLYAGKQLDFINGGWCMHDEAAPHYMDMIDQTTLGHRFLYEQFQAVPRIGWQIDPFGHSATQAALLSAEVGFDGLFFARIDYQDKQHREATKSLEVIWRASASLGAEAQVFTGAFEVGYGPPGGFNWDVQSNDAPMQDDPRLEDYNVESRVNDFVEECFRVANVTRANNIMFEMGSDFQYTDALHWFKNLDKLIHHVNLDGRVNVFYSTPTRYVQAKHEANITWPLKDNDFFPYANNAHSFWTGYFTSRPAWKRYVRFASGFSQMAKQILTLAGQAAGDKIETLMEAMGVAQHHDAVSGTAKQHVTFDYAKRIAKGYNEAVPAVGSALDTLTSTTQSGGGWSTCPLLNTSLCDATQRLGRGEGSSPVSVVLWNMLAQGRTEYVRLPIGGTNVSITQDGKVLSVDVVTSPVSVTNYGPGSGSPHTAVVAVSLPPVGYATIVVSEGSADNNNKVPKRPEATAGDVTIENDALRLTFSGTTGRLSHMDNKAAQLSAELQQDWMFYKSNKGDKVSGQPSGAYIFRPQTQEATPVSTTAPKVTVKKYNHVQEVTQQFCDWVQQTVRLYEGQRHAEIEYTIGPIPVGDGIGREVVSRFTSKMNTSKLYYTDSNGREMQQRRRNYRKYWPLQQTEPVAGNYYPVNTAAFIKDADMQFTVLTDASQGGGSITDGSLELMAHRRALHDDHFGVGEPINETEYITPYTDCGRRGCGVHYGPGLIIRGRYLLMLEKPKEAAKTWRPLQDRLYASLHPLFAARSPAQPTWTALTAGLPTNVQLLTLERYNGHVLLRLGHQFAVGEDAALSGPAQVDLATFFAHWTVVGIEELSLTANQLRSEMHRMQWKVEGENEATPRQSIPHAAVQGTVVTLKAMEVKTFRLTVQ